MQQRQLAALLAAIAVIVFIVLLGTGQLGRGPQPGASETASTTPPTSGETGSPPAATPTTAPAATPAITGLTGRIVFTRAGGSFGDETTFVANIDGSDETQIGKQGGSCCPWALRDGSRMVRGGAAPDGRLDPVFSDLDGAHETLFPLPKDLMFGAGPLSPDGKRIVLEGFIAEGFVKDHTYIADVDGTGLEVLAAEHFIPGDFSPDGKHVLLFKGPEGDPPPPGTLWVVDANGSNLHRLTPDATKVQCCFNYRWSPDGSKILFASPDGGLWTIAPDGTALAEVFHQADAWAITPTWSPDGSMILFALDPSPNPFAHPDNGFYVIRADGTDLTLVLGGNNFKREPSWVAPEA